MNQEENGSMLDRFKPMVGWIAIVAGALSVSVEVFLHKPRTFGERYVGLQGAAVILLVPIYATFWPGHDLRPLLWFLMAYLVMCGIVRMGIVVRRRRGGPQYHSRYTGTPRILFLTRNNHERTVKVFVEPMIVFVTGALTLALNQPLGGYLMLASLGLLISTNLNEGYDHIRSLDMHDAFLDQQALAARFRELNRDRYS